MAHGSFDLLHPGHVRHLEAAKALGDLLVVGVTSDRYVAKGAGRPAVPAEERAHALRQLRCVDAVFVDDHPTPEAAIAHLRPDIFVKGPDYAQVDLPERAWMAAVGGEVVCTQSPVEYHSRQWLTPAPEAPALYGVAVADLLGVLDAAPQYAIAVLGDRITDAYTQGEWLGPQIYRVGETLTYAGGAAVVRAHLEAAGARARLLAPARCAYKARYYTAEGLAIQIDDVDNTPLGAAVVEQLAGNLAAMAPDAVICADYRHGVFHPESVPVYRAALPPGPRGPLWVADSQVASRWGNILDFAGFDLITPNEREARWALGEQDREPHALVQALADRTRCASIILTRGADGLLYKRGGLPPADVPALAQHVADPVGAGDTLLAYATLGLLATGRLVVAAVLGAVAAALCCEQTGNAPIGADAVRARLVALSGEARAACPIAS
jgi:rfaE bifunctional protein nucleotidyltransferase chain/domain